MTYRIVYSTKFKKALKNALRGDETLKSYEKS